MRNSVYCENGDDKISSKLCYPLLQSVENCACILHNLTYHLEMEEPEAFSAYCPQVGVQDGSKKSSPIGCFSPKSSKAQKQVGINQNTSIRNCWPIHYWPLIQAPLPFTYLPLSSVFV